MIKKEPQLYVWIRSDGDVRIIDNPVETYQNPEFDKAEDRIHRLGEEVEIKIIVEVKNKTVYRESALVYHPPFANRD